MATISFVLRTQKKKSDNTVPIYIRLLEGEKCRFISTGCFIKEEDWDDEEVNEDFSLQLRAQLKKNK